jgi:hypothetical protein
MYIGINKDIKREREIEREREREIGQYLYIWRER